MTLRQQPRNPVWIYRVQRAARWSGAVCVGDDSRAMAQAVGQSPASHRGQSCSVLRQSMWDLWWTKWHWHRFLCKYFRCCLLEQFYHCSVTHRLSRALFKKKSYRRASSSRRFEISVVRFYSGPNSPTKVWCSWTVRSSLTWVSAIYNWQTKDFQNRVQGRILEPERLEESTWWKTLRFIRTCHRKLLRWSNRVWWIVWACSTQVGDLRFGFVFTPNSILTFSHCERIY